MSLELFFSIRYRAVAFVNDVSIAEQAISVRVFLRTYKMFEFYQIRSFSYVVKYQAKLWPCSQAGYAQLNHTLKMYFAREISGNPPKFQSLKILSLFSLCKNCQGVQTTVRFIAVTLTFQPCVSCFLVVGDLSFNDGFLGMKSICRRDFFSLGPYGAIREQ